MPPAWTPTEGNGSTEWWADVLRVDGLRVSVAGLNTRAYKPPGSRPSPVLDPDRLLGIASSTSWPEALDTPS
ncbi:hypothetical protein [Streptomyces sp. NPDC001792]|uniref:hypothetical protein n=1 Tax=unclassified Streptomyces TaxID=2593676 RepID=UPI003326C3F8